MAITVAQVITEMMLLWGIQDPNASATGDRARAMIDLNRSVQMLWDNAEKLDYFNQQEIQATLIANAASVALEAGVQNVIGPVSIAATGQALNPIKTRFDLLNYGPVYLGTASPVTPGPPVAYFLDRQFQNEPDSMALSIIPVPVPTVNTLLNLDVVMVAPAYTYDDYCNETVIPIPHAYGEAILIPLARHAAMSHFLFVVRERAPMIEAEYVEARKMLGLSAPEVDEIQPDVAPIVSAPWNQRRDR